MHPDPPNALEIQNLVPKTNGAWPFDFSSHDFPQFDCSVLILRNSGLLCNINSVDSLEAFLDGINSMGLPPIDRILASVFILAKASFLMVDVMTRDGINRLFIRLGLVRVRPTNMSNSSNTSIKTLIMIFNTYSIT